MLGLILFFNMNQVFGDVTLYHWAISFWCFEGS